MNMNRQTAIIATVAAAILCGCPGLLAAFMGVLFSAISFIPGAQIDVGGSSDPAAALRFGLASLCLGVVLVAIPAAVGYFSLRRARPTAPPPPPPPAG